MNKEERLGSAPLSKLMLSLAIPSVIAQVVNLLYNLVDRMYIGHIPVIGADALTGLGLCNPIILIVSAFSNFAGNGGAPLAAIDLGRGDRESAERILGNAVTLLVIFSVVLSGVFLTFKTPLLYLFGASENTISYANDYITIYLVGTLFVQLALGLNTFIICQGRFTTAMLSVVIGAVANIILDPIFIFAFDMGVQGAALATIISQALSAAWVVGFLCSKRATLRIRWQYLKPQGKTLRKIFSLGISPFIMSATESLVTVVFTSGLQRYGGDLYVGAMTVLQSTMQLIFIPVQGFTNGVQPIISYNYGAGKLSRVKGTFWRMLAVTAAYTCLFFVAIWLFPQLFASIFTSNADLLDLCVRTLPIYLGGIWLFGVQMSVQSAFLGLGQAKVSLFIACLRKIILLTPLAIILPRFFGVMGIYWAEPISDITSALTAGTLFLFAYKRLLSDKQPAANGEA